MARYRAVDIRIWFDDKFPRLSDDAKLLFFYYLTNPRGTMLGIAVQGKSDMADFLHWTPKRLAKPFGELLAERLILYHENTRTLYLPNFLKYNPIENENQAIGAAKCLDEIPQDCPYLPEVKRFLERLAKPFLKPLAERLGERYAKQEPEEVPGEEEVKTHVQKHVSAHFESFYQVYPKHKARAEAQKAWDKIKPDNRLLEKMLKAIEQQKKSEEWIKEQGKYIPLPATWLNGQRWEDEIRASLPPSLPRPVTASKPVDLSGVIQPGEIGTLVKGVVKALDFSEDLSEEELQRRRSILAQQSKALGVG